MEITAIERSMEHLEGLYRAKKTAADEFSDACKSVAEDSGVDRGVLAAFITARAGEKFDERKAKAEQLNLLFGEIA
jgi:hypothetical protein